MNITTRKFPRTLNEAFGPYAGTRYYSPKQKDSDNHPVWWLLSAALIITLVAICFSQA